MTDRPLWLIRKVSDLPPDLDWLSGAERACLTSLTVDKRRQDWLLGRWTAKQALISAREAEAPLDNALQDLEILPAPDGYPVANWRGTALPIALSLSHRAGSAFCCLRTGSAIGCDLELIEARSPAFIGDYFTDAEQDLIDRAGEEGKSVVANVLWSAKESVLKLLQVGLTIDARRLEYRGSAVELMPDWQRFTIWHSELARSFAGWWCRRGEWILTVATGAKTGLPVELTGDS